MGFTQARASVDEKRIKRAIARSRRYFLPCVFPKAVARTLNKIFKRILGIKLRIYMKLLQTWYYERIRNYSLIFAVSLHRERNRSVRRPFLVLVRDCNKRAAHNFYVVHKLNGVSKNLL